MAAVLAECGVVDERTLVGAVLHDTVEDTDTTPEELATLFGRDIAALVGCVVTRALQLLPPVDTLTER